MTLIYGHHGTRGEASENTLTSFQCCLEHGANRCELDLHLPRDDELMAIHDPTPEHTTDRRSKVAEHDAATPATCDARKGGPGWVRPMPTPRLGELFEKCLFKHWQLEVKNASRERAARTVTRIRELTERFGNRDKVTITSGSRTVPEALNELTPELSYGLVVEYVWPDPLKVAQHRDCALLTLSWTPRTPKRPLKAQHQGLHVSVWTVNEPALMHRLVDLGADSLITDFPGLASVTLGNR